MTATKTSPDDGMARGDLLRQCEFSARYHHVRERFLNTAHLSIQFVAFLLTTTSVVWLVESFISEWLGLVLLTVASALSLCSLIFRPAEKVGLHRSLYRRFTLLAGIISSTTNPSRKTRVEWSRRIHALFAEEAPLFDALLVQSANQVYIAHDDDPGYLVDLRFYHRWFRNLWRFQSTDFVNRYQKEKKKQTKQKAREQKRKQKLKRERSRPR